MHRVWPLFGPGFLHRRRASAPVRHGSYGLRYAASRLLRHRMTKLKGTRLPFNIEAVGPLKVSAIPLRFVILWRSSRGAA